MARTASPGLAASYLESRTQYGIKFGLETIRALVEALGHPERVYPTLLVAGTNGKGSVVAYVDAALRACGLRVGRYTSPHLVRVNERIAVGGRGISTAALDRAVGTIRGVSERLVGEGRITAHPTYFEALTAAAFEHFRRERVDVAVLEVGMGGRLDATNVCEPLASAIVSVDFDHEAFLGRTLTAIATEKAGVLRAGRTTVLGPLPPEALAAVERRAREVDARLVHAVEETRFRESGNKVDAATPRGRYLGLTPLHGSHQRDNLAVAIRLVEEAQAAGLAVDLSRLAAGINATRWPGRLEWVRAKPPLLLDGAHNPAGARALVSYLGRRPLVLLFGVMADKDVAEMARILFPLAEAIVLTQPRVKRAATPEAIAERAGAVAASAYLEPDPGRALALARRLAGRRRPVVVAGSLYLVGEVRRRLRLKIARAGSEVAVSAARETSRHARLPITAWPAAPPRPSRSRRRAR
jgi:dihydrofolate synthase/folylpolyglutamate synthase